MKADGVVGSDGEDDGMDASMADEEHLRAKEDETTEGGEE